MNARTLSAGLASVALISLALGCERGTPASAMLASGPAGLSPNFSASASNHHMRWDIVSINFATGTVSAGGIASARANLDLSKITLTGSGTFRSNPGNPQDVTGGGTWQTFDASGGWTGRGRFTGGRLGGLPLPPGPLPPHHEKIRAPPRGQRPARALRGPGARHIERPRGCAVGTCRAGHGRRHHHLRRRSRRRWRRRRVALWLRGSDRR